MAGHELAPVQQQDGGQKSAQAGNSGLENDRQNEKGRSQSDRKGMRGAGQEQPWLPPRLGCTGQSVLRLASFEFQTLKHESEQLLPTVIVKETREGAQALEELTAGAQGLARGLIHVATQMQDGTHQKSQQEKAQEHVG